MDSFLEGPRNAPEPISIEKFSCRPSVPEVSIICNNKTPVDNFRNNDLWKRHHQTERHGFQNNCAPGGYRNLQEQFSKKQVRFESPVLQEKPFNYTHCNKPLEANQTDYGEFSAARKQQLNSLKSNSPKPFERIYMANIPDRKLDLSLLDVSKPVDNINIHGKDEIGELFDKSNRSDGAEVKKDETVKILESKNEVQVENKENYMPKTYHDFLELQKKMTARKHKEHNDSVTDIFNYKKKKSVNNELHLQPYLYSKNNTEITQKATDNQIKYQDYSKYRSYTPTDTNLDLLKHKHDSETQTDIEDEVNSKALRNKKDHEPSNSDLLKIIAQQNEQLLLLQRQVAILLDRETNYPKSIEAVAEPDIQKNDNRKYSNASTPQKNHFRQENTITQQAGIFQDNQRKWGMSKFSINLTTSFEMPMRGQQKQNFINHEPKIQELTESDISPKTDNLEPSFHLQEPLNVREQCPSPQPSININMNDYESSDDEELVSEIGATFYNNLMGQVNNMLKKGKIETTEDETKKSRIMNKVKEATLKHLKSIGISVGNYEAPDNELNHNYTPSEISCTVKQLLMKYLPPDHPKKQENPVVVEKDSAQAFLAARPEFSMASLEYMRKYNLIPSKDKVPDFIRPVKAAPQQDWNRGDNRRILDLTALKMQPKLM